MNRFPLFSYAPFLSRDRAGHKSYTVEELTSACFNPENLLIKCDSASKDFERYNKHQSLDEKSISCLLLYRGDVSSSNVNAAIQKIQHIK